MIAIMNLFEPELDTQPFENQVLYVVMEEEDVIPYCLFKIEDKESSLYKFVINSLPCVNRGAFEWRIKDYQKFDCLEEYLNHAKRF